MRITALIMKQSNTDLVLPKTPYQSLLNPPSHFYEARHLDDENCCFSFDSAFRFSIY